MKRIQAVALLVALLFVVPSTAFAFGKNKIAYDRFDWEIYHSTHFDVYFYQEEKGSLQKVVNFAESAYDDLSRKFNFQIPKKIPLIFYATHSAFEQTNVDLGFIPEGVGAFAEPVRNRMVLPIDTTDEKLLQLITHELTHIFEYEILFQGKLGKSLTSRPPTWFMEGLASYMAQDEDSKDRMVLRDAVVNDSVPSITRNFGGYFAYRFGHAVFEYIQEKYGWEGLRDFIYEYRNTLGGSLEKPLKRAFEVTPEEFDSKFRTWLRRRYLPTLIEKGEPVEYGEVFRVEKDVTSHELSPIQSPSGDLLAAVTTYKEDADIVLLNIPERKFLKNLSRGYAEGYEYPIVQGLTTGSVMGRDLAFSPSGDQIALFVKKERGRNLMLINALTGRVDRSVLINVEQQLSPSYSPDGSKIVFTGFVGNQSDLFVYDLASGSITNLTNDVFFDGSPVYSPDGKWVVYSSIVDGWAKLFRLDVSEPSRRFQLTTGSSNDIDATFSPDGKRVFLSSDRQTGRESAPVDTPPVIETPGGESAAAKSSGPRPVNPADRAAYNIYSLNLENGDLLKYTDVVGGCFTPAVFIAAGNKERLVFSSYYKRRWQLYTTLTDSPLGAPEKTTLSSEPIRAEQRVPFLAPVEVTIDAEKVEKVGGFKLFIDDIQVNAGVNSDQTFISRSVILMSDMLGNKRFIASLDSVSTFSNFDFLYLDIKNRLNWGARVFDDRSFFRADFDATRGFQRGSQAYRQTGAMGILSYPFDRYHRVDVGAGYMLREIAYPQLFSDAEGNYRLFLPRKDSFPIVSSTFTGDNAQFKEFGPVSGRRYEVSAAYSADVKRGGTLSGDLVVDFRNYRQVTSRSVLAARLFAAISEGNFPNFHYFGGLNTLRGYDFRSIVGDRAFFANFEYRFPLIDLLATPVFAFQQVRGSLFFDIGGAFFNGDDFKFVEDNRLVDGKASVGYGIAFNLFGLELHWDFAKRTNLKDLSGKFQTTFWIGETF
ncbi:MAG TPA: BamA/TamA family outer membrane protein [Thermoanaerobaculia bacterium]|nr:BamA/TamA family outer membrane protein [Thermoanaerobaculia bacterium]